MGFCIHGTQAILRQKIKTVLKNFIYSFYQKRLETQSKNWQIPYHVGIVLDGNRRYAKGQGFSDIIRGHYDGADKLEDVLNWCDEFGIKIVTIWVFSLDNFKREQSEVMDILTLIEEKIRDMIVDHKVHKNQIRIRSMGRINLLPLSLQNAIYDAEEATKHYNQFILNIAVAYGGREEIIDAIQQHLYTEAESKKDIHQIADELTTELISPYLYTSQLPDPDLIIRTSGEIRLSGFLLWQSVYSEFYFCETYWPALRKIDFLRAIRDYSNRTRRFGT